MNPVQLRQRINGPRVHWAQWHVVFDCDARDLWPGDVVKWPPVHGSGLSIGSTVIQWMQKTEQVKP